MYITFHPQANTARVNIAGLMAEGKAFLFSPWLTQLIYLQTSCLMEPTFYLSISEPTPDGGPPIPHNVAFLGVKICF